MAVQGCKKADATGVILTFNGMRYAPLGTDLIAGCNGFYEAHKKAGDVKLYKPDAMLAALLINNPRQGQAVVTARMTDEGPWFMFSTDSIVEKWLGIESMRRSEIDDAIRGMEFMESESDVDDGGPGFDRPRGMA